MALIQNNVAVLLLYVALIESCASAPENCTRNIKFVSEYLRQLRRLVGEWVLINCTVNYHDINVQLLDENEKPLHFENKNIKIVVKNIFNVTKVTQDHKEYICKACNEKRTIRVIPQKSVPSYANPSITVEPKKTEYDLGDKVSLDCNIAGIQFIYASIYYKFFWKKNGRNKEKCETKNCKRTLVITAESEGTYLCLIERKYVNYKSYRSFTLKVKELARPKIYIENDADEFSLGEGKNLTFTYNVTSYPAADIFWSRLKYDGSNYQLLTRCFAHEKHCKNHDGQEKITRNKFEVKFVRFPDDSLTYQIKAGNVKGNEIKKISIKKLVVPEIDIKDTKRFLKKGFSVLNCTLKKKFDLHEVTFKWYMCQSDICHDHKNEMEYISSNYSLTVKKEGRYRCTANNGGEIDTSPIITVTKKSKPTENGQKKTMMMLVIPIGVLTLVILLITSYVLYKRKKLYGGLYLLSYPPLPDYIEKIDMNGDIHEQIQSLPFIPEWEFPRERIKFINELGSGEFGVVWLAEAVGISAFRPRDILREKGSRRRFSFFNRMVKRNSYVYSREVTKVAVKKIKDDGDRNKLIDLQSELKILIHVGENENIVNILGACTKGERTSLCIITEFCEHGNLRQFLRDSRNRYNQDKEYMMNDLSLDFGPQNLIQWAYHIIQGMEFLISRKIIHRDLAARNILLGTGYIAKVGDFGLARDIYKYQVYTKNTPGLLPLKWMAIESIKDSVYTEKSDMWSFGVVLFELFTLGGTPYPGLHVSEVYAHLLNGNRMEPPIYCPDIIADLMKKCWIENPQLRPTFEEAKKMVEKNVPTISSSEKVKDLENYEQNQNISTKMSQSEAEIKLLKERKMEEIPMA
ncbi:mast/stem cell growth factor receptor kita-like isoform X2 [Xenia sp. Carnegie-2017]|uniref:mast/stem cell growth factor receptor kita-like isoform X2 n=1 Tax=Xenia sp. Carnegie-2017 TaxID=2897299 RepID=UPI001F036D69|nr:mast/stem cell growth factor receptor kita-like isoform X2 [Xenia sp. Carnegie-2017]